MLLQAAQLKHWAAARFAFEAALAVNPSNVISLEVRYHLSAAAAQHFLGVSTMREGSLQPQVHSGCAAGCAGRGAAIGGLAGGRDSGGCARDARLQPPPCRSGAAIAAAARPQVMVGSSQQRCDDEAGAAARALSIGISIGMRLHWQWWDSCGVSSGRRARTLWRRAADQTQACGLLTSVKLKRSVWRWSTGQMPRDRCVCCFACQCYSA